MCSWNCKVSITITLTEVRWLLTFLHNRYYNKLSLFTFSRSRAISCTPCIAGTTYNNLSKQSECLPCPGLGYNCSNPAEEPKFDVSVKILELFNCLVF